MTQPSKLLNNVLAIDPGGTTGLAFRINGKIGTSTTGTPKQLYDFILELQDQWQQIIVEDFASSGKLSTYGLYTIRLIGGIEALCIEHRIPITVQMPQFRYHARMAAEHYWTTTTRRHVIHEHDALMHLLAWEEDGLPGSITGPVRDYTGSHK